MTFYMPGTRPPRENGQTGRPTVWNRRWRIFWSYAPDWAITIFFWGIFYLLDKVDGYRRLFSVTDESLAHPYTARDRVPVWLLAIVCGLIPGLIILLTGGLYRRSFWDAHAGILGFILSLGLSVTLTNIIKITVGRPRPDLFDRCQLPDNLTSNPIHGLTSWQSCTRTNLLQDGFRSFPSGHSSFAWAGMWYLILFAAAKMRISNRKGYTWKSWLLIAPLSCALLVAISRTMDYRHHATDVIAGGILGVLTAWYGYRQYYPPIDAPQSYKPYSPRIPNDTEKLPLHNHTRQSTDHHREHSAFIAPSAYDSSKGQSQTAYIDTYASSPGMASASLNSRTPHNAHNHNGSTAANMDEVIGVNGHAYPPAAIADTYPAGVRPGQGYVTGTGIGGAGGAGGAGAGVGEKYGSERMETVERDRS